VGILDEDIARVRAASDFVAIASEYIAFKRVGRNYQGLCPFHSEKSPSFSISPEKGVYFCYGCQAKGDVITFVRDLEHLDFAGAVERLAGKANLTLRYDNEATSRDRQRRTALVEAMEQATLWYHNRLLTSPDAGPARSYLRSRGYDGEAIRAFRIGWAPDGWDTLCKALRLPTDVARDTGLGYLNKIGKTNDFFQKRILFPIFDATGNPIAFGGRKLPDADGPKYKNSAESKLYSKSRTLYGLNWAKNDIVASGEVIVCEGYTDVIGFHRAGLPRAVATCGTSLAEEHFKTLKNFARRIVLAYDADNAGQSAAEKFYAWEKQYEIDIYVVSLPDGADPADLARSNPTLLADAVTNARPFLSFRIERLLKLANLKTPEGRARAFEEAADAVLAHPNALVREQYLKDLAGRCQISDEAMARTLEAGPRPRKPDQRRDSRNGPDRPSADSGGDRAPSGDRYDARGGSRRTSNEPDDRDSYAEPLGSRQSNSGRLPSSQRSGAVRGRATSVSTQLVAAERSQRAEREALRWVLSDPGAVLAWLHPSFFADAMHRSAFVLATHFGDIRAASDALEEQAEADRDQNSEEHQQFLLDKLAVDLLHELAVETPISAADDTIAILVGNAATRAIAAMSMANAQSGSELDAAAAQAIGPLKLLAQELHEPRKRAEVLGHLVPWLSAWAHQQSQATIQTP
jgi:DNA primase